MYFKNTYNLIFIFLIIFFFTCEKQSSNPSSDPTPIFEEETIILDVNGNVVETSINIDHFASSQDCQACHPQHYDEWKNSMHAHSFNDPIFLNLWIHERENRPNTGVNYCIQCHAPSAFVSGEDLSMASSLDDISDMPSSIKEGISCQFCHNTIGFSSTINTENNVAALADYRLSVSDSVMFGSIIEPGDNLYHDSYYLPIYNSSRICLPCHNQFIRGEPIEATFTEWSSSDDAVMLNDPSCQSCHMPGSDGHHDHSFAGVDFYDLTLSLNEIENSLEYAKNEKLLKTAVELNFSNETNILSSVINANDTLDIPLTIQNNTGHKLPSGTNFSREAWIELLVKDANDNLVFSSGFIENNKENLNYLDENLIFFTTWLLDEGGDTISEASNAYSYIDSTLEMSSLPNFYNYKVFISDELVSPLSVSGRMLFRAFKPTFLDNLELDNLNIPIYEMYRISQQIDIID